MTRTPKPKQRETDPEVEMTDKINAALEAADRMRLAIFGGPLKCPYCGWPMMDRIEDGCVAGDCSQRPVPHRTPVHDACAAYDAARRALANALGEGK